MPVRVDAATSIRSSSALWAWASAPGATLNTRSTPTALRLMTVMNGRMSEWKRSSGYAVQSASPSARSRARYLGASTDTRTGLVLPSGENSGSRMRATTGSPTRPIPSAARVTPSWTAEMYESSEPRICIALRARMLPASISSWSWVPRTRMNAYSAETKNAFTKMRRTKMTSAKPVALVSIRTDSRTYHWPR